MHCRIIAECDEIACKAPPTWCEASLRARLKCVAEMGSFMCNESGGWEAMSNGCCPNDACQRAVCE